ncbi:MAG: hypothetical protein LBP32_00400 [Spirochaetaceae bacterium]|jgi:hypothetical protein|nr:hypothetical protein [Spirochaetaceae bacterium]
MKHFIRGRIRPPRACPRAGNVIGFFGIWLFLVSCSSLPFYVPSSGGWSPGGPGEFTAVVALGTVSVDKSGGGASAEREIAGLVPLIFLEEGYGFSFDEAEADYRTDLRAMEREYLSGWRTERSVSVEVRIWRAGEDPDRVPPLAAGRATASGIPTLSSSRDLSRLLRSAIKKAASALEKQGA